MSHGLLGASLGAAASTRREQMALYGVIGGAAALTPDLDLFIQSATDPVLTLEYHRAFSHSLAFSVALAAALTLVSAPWTRRRVRFRAVFFLAWIGILSHLLLDACTTYGTEMLWPFSPTRVASSSIAVFDPFFTVPIAILLFLSLRRGVARYALTAIGWAVVYIVLSTFQQTRAADAAAQLAASRNHVPTRLVAIPSLGSNLLWKTIYEADGRFFIDGVRTGLGRTVFPGTAIAALDVATAFPELDSASQQARDIERFSKVADGFVAVDPAHPERVVDLRYSLVPQEIAGFWAIVVDPAAPAAAHVSFVGTQEGAPAEARRLLALLFGRR